ncbi:MAG: hypothetical protein KIG97_09160 [Fibrobacter sp.]|uniref:hypothetical protein n=1 Tax=Fibrobacter sp. TaxID=35828 RepID=UPI0025C3D980|nr:hypothetical protein [Fibrobacter sp.]MBS7272517.1 hypothetical protein [Fibrobacter sp.]
MTEEKEIRGLTPVRTVRVISTLVALMGMVFLLMQRVLSAVLQMATDGLNLGLARYNTFTGRMALQNFPEDRQLFKLLKDVQSILPSAEMALTVFMVVAIVLLAVALVGLALPRPYVHVLVALKILKWKTGDADEVEDASLRDILEKIGDVPLKKLAIPFGIVIAIVVVSLVVYNCHDKIKAASVDGALDELQQQAATYISAQRFYFAQKKVVGGAKALQLPDSLSTDAFTYKITGSRFLATSKVPLGDCPAGTKWYVSASVKGVFEKELQLYRALPKDSACAKLTPEFKNIGRK